MVKNDLLNEEKKIEKLEKTALSEEKKIEKLLKSEVIENKHIYEKLLELEKKLVGDLDLKFDTIDSWKDEVWKSCEYKEEKESPYTIEFICKKQGTNCHFHNCPENVKH